VGILNDFYDKIMFFAYAFALAYELEIFEAKNKESEKICAQSLTIKMFNNYSKSFWSQRERKLTVGLVVVGV
jgi:hypothetical protein